MSGVRLVQGPEQYNRQSTLALNSEHIESSDFVTIDSATGCLKRSGASDRLQGNYLGKATDYASDNQTVAKLQAPWQPTHLETVYEMDADQACTQADVGGYASLALSGNKQVVNLPANFTAGQVQIIDFDPAKDGTTTKVRVKVAFPQELAFKVNS